MDDAKKALTPMPTTGSLVHNDRSLLANVTKSINFYFVWNKVASRELYISHVLSQDQLVDPHHTTFPTMPSPVNIQD
ncbi:hypothetical protein AAG906_013696 [Vitis piasezkii]